MVILKSRREIERMRKSCQIVAEVLALVREQVVPGVTTKYLDAFAAKEAQRRGAKCAFKGYSGYPSSLCCSPNEQVVHGIPNNKPLNSGDILSLDFGVLFDDFYGDAAVTLPVGFVSDIAINLLNATEKSLYAGIENAVVGKRLSDISHAIQAYVETRGFSVVRDFVGHGIGRGLHEDPQVPNFGKPSQGLPLKAGMVLAIEPMINVGSYGVDILSDGWTVVTKDRSLSAHFEHTVAITEDGPDILTQLG